MNATAALAAVAQSLEDIREAESAAALARASGHPTSTISRDRVARPIIDWPARDLLLLARALPQVRSAVELYLADRPQKSGATESLPEALRRDGKATHLVDEAIRDGLLDGRLTVREINEILTAIAARRQAGLQLERDLRAARRQARP